MSFGLEFSGLIISGISALASLVSAWRTARSQGHDLADDEIDDAISSSSSSSWSSSSEEMSTLSSTLSAQVVNEVIPPALLDVMRNNITQRLSRLTEALADPDNTGQEKDKEADAAASAVCRELQRIRKFNSGRLPEDLQRYWESFSCN